MKTEPFLKLIIVLGVRLQGLRERQSDEKDVLHLLETNEYECINEINPPAIKIFRAVSSKLEMQTHIIIGDRNVVTSIHHYCSPKQIEES